MINITQMLLRKYCVLLFCFVSVSVFSQKDILEIAERAFDSEEYYNAITLYKKSYSKEKDKEKKAEIVYKLAECYRLTLNTKQAETWYKKAIRIKYPEDLALLHLADMMKMNGKYEEAIVEYKHYLEKAPGNERAEKGVKSCELSKEWVESPTRYEVENVALLNSRESDFSPTYAKKNFKEIIFTSTRDGGTGSAVDGHTGESFSDLWFASLDKKGKWSTPTPLVEPVNSKDNEGAATMNRKYNTIYFTRCPNEKNQVMGCQIFSAPKRGSTWGDLELIPLFDSITVGHPALSPDDMELYFSSDMEGGMGGKDLWVSKYDKRKKEWSKPENLGATINTSGDEMYPFMHSDGSLYFSSNGHVGMGGLDNFKAEKTGDSWDKVTNMRFPLNSEADDFGIVFEDKNEKGFFTSNRHGGKGGDDIYSFVLPPLEFTIQGVITDAKTEAIVANSTVKLVGTDGTDVEVTTDKTGSYKFELKPNTSYVVQAWADGYFKDQKKESTIGIEEDRDFVVNIPLNPEDKAIELENIFYDFNSADLRPESEESLMTLVEFLEINPTYVMELSSHTDFRGSDKYNEDLSQRRAQSVVTFLINHGLESERLVPKGYGEEKPKTIEKKDAEKSNFKEGEVLSEKFIKKLKSEEEQEAAHQFNRRTEIIKLRDDYVPKNSDNSELEGSTGGSGGVQ